MNPSEKCLKIDSFPDANFHGMYRHEATGILSGLNEELEQQSKLQSETALSTVEAEIIALAYSCCKLLPTTGGVSIMGKTIDFPVGNTTILVLAKILAPQFSS